MKKILLFSMFTIMLLASCSVSTFYQVYQVNRVNNPTSFSDKNCIIHYNLWSDNGNPGFTFRNISTQNITIDLSETFFVINGFAQCYFKARFFTSSKYNSNTNSFSTYIPYTGVRVGGSSVSANGAATTYEEQNFITVPPNTFVVLSEFEIVDERYVNCDLIKYPTKRNIKSVTFTENESPFLFYNIITYVLGLDTNVIKNQFFVEKITNYPENAMFSKIDTSKCGRKLTTPIEAFKDDSNDKFYFKYTQSK